MGGWRRNLSLRLAFLAREGVGRDDVDVSCTEVAVCVVDASRRKVKREWVVGGETVS